VTKLPTSHRIPLIAAMLALVATGCDGDQAQLWHYWIAPVMMLSAVLVVCVLMPLAYYFKVYRLKQRGR
jgi:ABC-type Na+ efflux pump permease subunit